MKKIMNTELVRIYDETPRAGTFLIAKGFERKHEHIIKLIDKHKEDFEIFSHLRSEKKSTKGRPTVEYLLDENQTMLLGTYLRNSDKVRTFKIKLIQNYSKLKKQLNALQKHKAVPEYQVARNFGKLVRKETTDEMKEFIEYAKEQGSKHAEKYYTNITQMMNGMLFIVEGKFKNLRDVLSVPQLMTISSAEQIIDKALRSGMKSKMFYKDIYQDIKSKVELFAELHGQSQVIADCLAITEN